MKKYEMQKFINNAHVSNRRKIVKKLQCTVDSPSKDVNGGVEISMEEFCNTLAA